MHFTILLAFKGYGTHLKLALERRLLADFLLLVTALVMNLSLASFGERLLAQFTVKSFDLLNIIGMV